MIEFNGSNQYIRSASTFTTTGTGTWCLWVRPISFSATDSLIGMENEYKIRTSAGGNLEINLYRKFNKTQVSVASLTPGTLYHIACAYEPSGKNNRIATYINGVLDIDDTNQDGSVSDTNITVGASYGGTEYSNSAIGGVRHYDRFLSASEIATIYACQGTDGIVDGLTAYWPMKELADGDTVTNAIDIAGSNDLSTINGTPVYREVLLKRRAA